MIMEGLNGTAAELIHRADLACNGCGTQGLTVFFQQGGMPVQTMLLMPTREAAQRLPVRETALAVCGACGLICNTMHQPFLMERSSSHETTKRFSRFHTRYMQGLSSRLVKKYGLYGKEILEIGPAEGELLDLLCELGGNRGTGFDPAFNEGLARPREDIKYIKDYYSEKYQGLKADMVICRLTLDHAGGPAWLLKNALKAAAGDGSVFFFQAPDFLRALRDLSFWEICYERGSYFTDWSLSKLLASSGFRILDKRSDYGGRYISIEAAPGAREGAGTGREEGLHELAAAIRHFMENYIQKASVWKKRLAEMKKSGYRAVLWGAGSKAVSFLSALGVTDEISHVVDMNPCRQGSFTPRTGHEIVSPAFLKKYRPDVVIAANPVYSDEISHELRELGVQPNLVTL